MTKQELIERLEGLQVSELEDGFPSQAEAVQWAAEVAPLLKFNNQYYVEFRHRAQTLSMNLSEYTQGPNLQRMAAILHEAIVDLESEVEPEGEKGEISPAPPGTATFEWPQRPTLAWYWKHMPASAWGWLIGLLLAAGGLSFAAGRAVEQMMNPRATVVGASKAPETVPSTGAENHPINAPAAQTSTTSSADKPAAPSKAPIDVGKAASK